MAWWVSDCGDPWSPLSLFTLSRPTGENSKDSQKQLRSGSGPDWSGDSLCEVTHAEMDGDVLPDFSPHF